MRLMGEVVAVAKVICRGGVVDSVIIAWCRVWVRFGMLTPPGCGGQFVKCLFALGV